MNGKQLVGGALAAAFLLAGCTRSDAATAPAAKASAAAPTSSRSSVPSPTAGTAAVAPSAATRMICAAEVRTDLAKILALRSLPAPTSRWADRLYTCTYRLPQGPLVVSVKQLPDAAATRAHYTAQRQRAGTATDAIGLTASAFRTPAGVVALVKDSNVLTVDATALPVQFGPQHQKRTDLAYEVASTILGCWTGG